MSSAAFKEIMVAMNGRFTFPSLYMRRKPDKVWRVSVTNRNELITLFGDKEWTKRFATARDALDEAKARFIEKLRNGYSLPQRPTIPTNEFAIATATAAASSNHLPCILQPVFNNTPPSPKSEWLAWYDEKFTKMWRLQKADEDGKNDAEEAPEYVNHFTSPLLFDDFVALVHRFPSIMWFFDFGRLGDEIYLHNVYDRSNPRAPWLERHHLMQQVTNMSKFIRVAPSVVVETEEELQANIEFYRVTPDVKGVRFMNGDALFSHEASGLIIFSPLENMARPK